MKWIVEVEVEADTEQEAREKVEPAAWKRLKIVSVQTRQDRNEVESSRRRRGGWGEEDDDAHITGAPR